MSVQRIKCVRTGAPPVAPKENIMSRKAHYDSPEFMSVPETARYLGVGRKMVYQLLENDQLIFARERGAIRILTASVVDFQSSGRMT